MGNSQSSSSESPQCESLPSYTDCPTFPYKERKYFYTGGNHQEFEEFKCAICLNVIAEPVQTSCGHLFCEQCIEDHKKSRNECPTCRTKDFTTTQDGYVARKIGGIHVRCPNAAKRCSWKGTLGQSIGHLRNGCMYEEVQCEYCGHGGNSREVNCFHRTWCEAFPLRCPNQPGCRAMVTRETLDDHLAECPEQPLACKFAPAGCTAIVSRKNFEEHLRVGNDRHDHLWKGRIEQFSDIVLTSQMNTTKKNSSNIGKGICYMPWLCNPCLKERPTPPYILAIERQSTSVKGRFEAESDPFYSHAGGYKFQLHVVVSFDRGARYIGASVHLLEGENDNHLMFPFKGTLTLSLMNQRIDGGHQEKVLQLNPKFCQRENRGILQFSGSFFSMLPRCWWKDSSSRIPCYVADDRLYIKVSSVDFDRDYMSKCLRV